MKSLYIKIHLLILFEVMPLSLMSYFQDVEKKQKNLASLVNSNEQIKQEAFEILKTKCNICHRKKNPFMVFNFKNMDRRAEKIYIQVFTLKRMPKGDEINLSAEEYQILKNWLNTQNIF